MTAMRGQIAERYGDRFRAARFGRFRQLARTVLAERGSCHILDVGGLARYWRAFGPDLLDDERVHITLVNLSYASDVAAEPRVRLMVGDARTLDGFESGGFDIAHSNSVIEHVGRWGDMWAMADAVRRVARQWWVQTPYWGFPVEPHCRTPFFHWLPEQWRYRLVLSRRLGNWARATTVDQAMRAVQSNSLLDRRQMQALFPESTIYSERVAGLTKSLVAVGGLGLPRDPRSNTRRLLV